MTDLSHVLIKELIEINLDLFSYTENPIVREDAKNMVKHYSLLYKQTTGNWYKKTYEQVTTSHNK